VSSGHHQEGLIELLRKAELTEQLVFEIYAKLLVDGQRNSASLVSNERCVFRGNDLLQQETERRQWLASLDRLTEKEVAQIDSYNRGWAQAYKAWKKTSKSMSRAREILGLNMSLSVSDWVKAGRLTHFRATGVALASSAEEAKTAEAGGLNASGSGAADRQ
jgi:hypothetical protein